MQGLLASAVFGVAGLGAYVQYSSKDTEVKAFQNLRVQKIAELDAQLHAAKVNTALPIL